MTCAQCRAQLAAYWLGELGEPEEQALEEHTWGCDACARAAEKMAGLVAALRARVPATLSVRAMEVLERRGLRLKRTVIGSGERVVVEFGGDVDLLVHRLQAELRGVERLDVELLNAEDGGFLMAIPGLAFEAEAGEVNLVCQRHYVEMFPPDAAIRLWAVPGDGESRRMVGEYGVLHVLPGR